MVIFVNVLETNYLLPLLIHPNCNNKHFKKGKFEINFSRFYVMSQNDSHILYSQFNIFHRSAAFHSSPWSHCGWRCQAPWWRHVDKFWASPTPTSHIRAYQSHPPTPTDPSTAWHGFRVVLEARLNHGGWRRVSSTGVQVTVFLVWNGKKTLEMNCIKLSSIPVIEPWHFRLP